MGWFVMLAAGIRTHKCSYCGVCGRSRPRTPWFFDKDLPCACGCNNRRRELWKLFTGTKIPDILPLHTGLLGNGSFQNRNLHKLKATFCIEPHGDTLTRKSFYESIMLGCIPVVFREDALYLGQLPYSHTIPYRKLWVAIPRGTPFGPEIFAYLRAIKPSEIIRRRRLIKRYGRRLVFSSNSSQHGGYNDFGNPDASASALKEVWDRSKQKIHMPLATPAKYKCRGPPCDPQCKLQNKDHYTDVGVNWGHVNLSASHYPKVYILPVSSEYNEELLGCKKLWVFNSGDRERFQRTSPAQPFGSVEKFHLPEWR